MQFSGIKYINSVVQPSPPSLELILSCETETLYPLNNSCHFLFPPSSGNHQSTFCLSEFDYYRYLILIESCNICLFVFGLFYLAWMKPSKFIQIVAYVRIFLLRPTDIPLYVYATFSLSNHPAMDILFPPFGYPEWCCYENGCPNICLSPCFYFFWYIPKSGIKSYINSVFDFLRNHHAVCHSACTILQYHWQCMMGSNFSTFSPIFVMLVFIFTIAILMGMKWCLIMVLICISSYK